MPHELIGAVVRATLQLGNVPLPIIACVLKALHSGPGAHLPSASVHGVTSKIGFDAMGTKQAGWAWLDQGQTSIELYGAACTSFKTSLRTNILVELGCEQIIVAPD
jgi:hypothetical protein